MNNMKAGLIAPCGINCRLCMVYQRDKKNCKGCNGDDASKPNHCLKCAIKNCSVIQNNTSGLCHECDKFPCPRLKQLDARYRTNYKMSLIENLNNIKQHGMEKFLREEDIRWICTNCGNIVCVHHGICLKCKSEYSKQDYSLK